MTAPDDDRGDPVDATTTIPPFPEPEELALPHFEARLLARLHDRQRSGAWPSPASGRVRASSLDLGVRSLDLDREAILLGRTGPDRPLRRWGRALAVAAVLLVMAGGAAVLASGRGDSPVVGTGEESEVRGGPSPKEQILAAIETAERESVVHTQGSFESWTDAASGAARLLTVSESGRPWDRGRSVAPSVDEAAPSLPPGEETAIPDVPTRIVDHCLRQYADTEEPFLSVGSLVSSLRQGLAEGWWSVDGTEVVEGRELIRLVEELPDPVPAASESRPLAYVDPETFLAVRFVNQDAVTDAQLVTTVEYLPRTPETLSLLVPPVPDGFTEVEQIAPNEDRAAGCL